MSIDTGALRIGEFARRVGVTPELLRAWERRYGLLQPIRTEGGFRLYSSDDAERVGRMKRALDEGFSAAEAAQRALVQERTTEHALDGERERLVGAAHAYDEVAVHAILDEALAGFSLVVVRVGADRPAVAVATPTASARASATTIERRVLVISSSFHR